MSVQEEETRSAEQIQLWLLSQVADLLMVGPDELDIHASFESFGLSSRDAVLLSGDLEDWLGRRLSPTLVWEHPTIAALSAFLSGRVDEAGTPAPLAHEGAGQATRDEPIAIVGIGCRFPGADGPDAFWTLLCDGVDAITEVPADRWDVASLFSPERFTPGKMNTRWGGFLDGLDEFDHDFFSIAPREASRMDPQQRLLMEVAWEALEDAGIPVEEVAGMPVGVFVGISSSDYAQFQFGDLDLIDAYAGTGNAHSIAANRLSYFFDLRGPSVAVDTACSSSLVAVHQACQSLYQGECDLALAGGVNVILSPAITINFSKAGAMAADGRCKAFDARGDGYVRGEGAGLVVLKPLSRALADRDTIYALVLGSAVNQDGRSNGLMAPNPKAQEAVIRIACKRAGVPLASIDYVEAHGTGTLLGDPIEAQALGSVLGEGRAPEQRCLIGSVKTNIGHLEAAAGIASLIKVALALKHATIPPSLHFETPNPHIPFDTLPIAVQTALSPWPQSGRPLYAGVSSFGFGGTNAHAVLQSAPPTARAAPRTEGNTFHLLPISAHSAEALHAQAAAYHDLLGASSTALEDVCYTASQHRSHHAWRLAVLGASRAEMQAALQSYLDGDAPLEVIEGRHNPNKQRRVVFVFSGHGSQWVGMGRQLLQREAVFREALANCDTALQPLLDRSLFDLLEDDSLSSALEEIDVIQPLLFAIQVGLATLWRSLGIEPDAVVGHSMGETAAAHVAGALGLADAAQVIYHRSQLLKRVSGSGTMLAVGLPRDEMETVITREGAGIAIAVINGPGSTVLSGDREALVRIADGLPSRIFCKFVKVDVAAHSPQMDPLLDELRERLEAIHPVAAQIPFCSTVTGTFVNGSELDADYWARNFRQPVLFADAVQSLKASGHDSYVEISPHPLLLTAVRQGLGSDVLTVPSLRRAEAEQRTLLTALATLWAHGLTPAWQQLYPGARQRTRLPHYPWQRKHHWLDVAPTWQRVAGPGREESRDEGIHNWLYEVSWLPIATGEAAAKLSGLWLVFADAGGVADQLTSRLGAAGAGCVVVRRGPGFRRVAQRSYELDPLVASDFARLLDEIRAEVTTTTALAGVVHLWSLDVAARVDDAAVETALALGCGSVLHLVQAMSELDFAQEARLMLVTKRAQVVTGSDGQNMPAQALLAGLGRTIRQEFPRLRCTTVDLDRDIAPATVAAMLLAEVEAEPAEELVALRAQTRYVARLVPFKSQVETRRVVRKDATYLISGGLGGLGMTVARWLAAQGAENLVLFGRSKPTPAVEEQLQQLRRAGVNLLIASCDVADSPALTAVLDEAHKSMPPLRGVVHAAAVLEDAILVRQTWETFKRVMPAKIGGAWTLHQLTADDPLDFFVLFSSVASLLGSPGQGNYAAANAFLDALAHWRRAQGLPALSINWGPWAGVGLAADEHLVRRFDRWGLTPIPPAQGVETLGLLLQQESAQLTVLPVDWSRSPLWQHGAMASPFLSLVPATPDRHDPAGGARRGQLSADASARPALAGDRSREALTGYLRALVAKILYCDAAEIKPDTNLAHLGIDSIMTMELIRNLEQDFEVRLYPREIMERSSLNALAEYLEGVLGEAGASPHEVVFVETAGVGPVALAGKRDAGAALAPAKENPAVLFLLSAPRSGSTLLRVMLAGHPGLFAPPELHLLGFDTMRAWREGLANTYVGEGLEIAFRELRQLDADASRALVNVLVAEDRPVHEVYGLLQAAAKPRILVDKSPSYGANLETLERAERLFADARYVHLVRHPYAVVESVVRMRFDKLLGAGEVDPHAFAEQIWATINSNIIDFLAGVDPTRALRLNFEDLVQDPERTMRDLCAFLQLPFDPAVLDPYRGERMTGGLYPTSLPIGDPNFAGYGRIVAGRGNAWTQVQLPRRLSGVTRRISEELSYELPREGTRRIRTEREPTVGNEKHSEKARDLFASPLVALQEEGDRPPVFFIHPGSGIVYPYYELARSLGRERPFYALQDLSLGGEREPYPHIVDYAAEYLPIVRDTQPAGPYILGGWSFGGHVAVQMAHELREAGEEVGLLLILDTEAPVGGRKLTLRQRLTFLKNRIIEYATGAPDLIPYIRDALYLLMTIEGRQERAATKMGLYEYLQWSWTDALRRRLGKDAGIADVLARDGRLENVKLPGTSVRRGLYVLRKHIQLVNQFEPPRYQGDITFLRASDQIARKYFTDESLGWRDLIDGEVKVHVIPGNHITLFREPHVHTVAEVIRACIAASEATA